MERDPQPAQQSGRLALLERLFAPATHLLNKLSYARKFVLIAGLLLVPIGSLFFLQFSGIQDSITFNAKELLGVTYIEATREVLHDIQGLRLTKTIDPMLDNDVDSNRFKQSIAQHLQLLEATDKLLGDELKTTERYQEMVKQWKALASNLDNTSVAEAEQALQAISAIAVDIILNYAGNYSNLILDPSLDSYWLMDMWVARLPALTESLTLMTKVAVEQTLRPNQANYLQLAGLYNQVRTLMSDLKNIDMATAIKETKYELLATHLEPPFNLLYQEVGEYLDSIEQGVLMQSMQPQVSIPNPEMLQPIEPVISSKGGKTSKSPVVAQPPVPVPSPSRQSVAQQMAKAKAYRQQGEKMLDMAHQFYQKVGPDLATLVDIRVQDYSGQRLYGVAAALLFVLLLAYLFIAFYQSIRMSIITLGNAMARMIAGTAEQVEMASRDELGQVADQINIAIGDARETRRKADEENRELQRSVVDLLRVVATASEGDLSIRAKVSAGALGNVADAFNQHQENFQRLIKDIMAQVQGTQKVVEDVSEVARKIATEASNQSSEVQQALKLVQRMTQEVQQVSRNAVDAAEASKRTESSATLGTNAVGNVVNGMEQLRANVQAGAKKIKNLGDRSMEITQIVQVISRISEQTNMLALNAAIEAARAGEQGRGFTVVAEEVRKLAERTARATEEIGRLVQAIHTETTESVQAIEQQTAVVEEESQVVAAAGSSLQKILEAAEETANLAASIRTLAEEQAGGTTQVADTIKRISQLASNTQQGAQGAEKRVAELLQASQQLTKSIARFRVG